jgi:hypothetical protein
MKSIAVSVFGECSLSLSENSRWYSFIEKIKELDLEIVSIENASASFYLSIDHSIKNYNVVEKRIPVERRFLVVIEPPSIMPHQFETKVTNLYGGICTTPFLQEFFERPIVWTPGFTTARTTARSESTKSSRSLDFGLLSSNKFSALDSSLYLRRKQIVRQLSKRGFLVVVGGKDWDKKRRWYMMEILKTFFFNLRFVRNLEFRNFLIPLWKEIHPFKYEGVILNSTIFLSQFKFVLCIESDIYDFSEKIFDVLEAGSIPLYLGPKIESLGIPENLFFRMPNSPKEFAEKAIELIKNYPKIEASYDFVAQSEYSDFSRDDAFEELGLICHRFFAQHDKVT